MKPFLRRILADKTVVSLLVVIVVLIGLRFAILPYSPPGFYIDEAASGAHAIAMVHNHTNAHGVAWPLFSKSLGGGYTTPVYLYPLSAWAAVFGFSEFALRAFSQFATVISILLIAASVRLWLGKRSGLIAAIIGLALPWSWLQGSLAWDPALVPLYLSIAILGWSLLAARKSRKARIAGLLLLPIGIILLAYDYPPYWPVAPLLAIGAYVTLLVKKRFSVKQLIVTMVLMAIAVIPLVMFIISPDSLGRSSSVSVFHNASIIEGLGLFIRNIGILINPFFLFMYGDFNPRHSIGWQGMLGVAALIPIIVFFITVVRKLRQKNVTKDPELYLSLVAIAGFLLSLIGSALTNEGQPQSLRASGAWPFAVIMITLGWMSILRYKAVWLKWTALSIFVIMTILYVIDLRFMYPQRCAWAFDEATRQKIEAGQPVHYSRLSLEYYKNR